jgi:hypothetical protein
MVRSLQHSWCARRFHLVGYHLLKFYFVFRYTGRNFLRVSKGPESGAYYHHFFLRDKPHLAAQMFCKNARTILAMATNEKKPNTLETIQGEPNIPNVFTASIPQQRFDEMPMNLPISAPVSSLYYKNNLNPSNLNVLGSSEPSNRLHLLDHPMMIAQYHQQQQESTTYGLLEDMVLRMHNDRQSAAINLQQQQSAAAVAALEADYLRRIHMQRMVEISMQELQKRDEAVFHLGNSRLPSPPKSNSGGSPPSGTKRASAA